MNTVLLAALVLLIVLLAIMLLRQSPAAVLQQQLIELRDRLDRLTASQQDVPRALASGSAEQTRALADVRERLAQLNEATRRLESLGQQVGEVHQLLQIPKLRGNLGEVMLEQLLAEILPDGQYATQYGFSTGRVDAVIKLGGRLMFPLVSIATVVPVLYLGFFAQSSYTAVLVGGFFLGIGGTAFAVGVPFVNAWYPPERRGTAVGICTAQCQFTSGMWQCNTRVGATTEHGQENDAGSGSVSGLTVDSRHRHAVFGPQRDSDDCGHAGGGPQDHRRREDRHRRGDPTGQTRHGWASTAR